jgi:hypothetical protein
MRRSFVRTYIIGSPLVAGVGSTAADGAMLAGAVYNLSGSQAVFDHPSFRGAELAVAVERYRTIEEQSDALASLPEVDVVFLSAEEPAEATAGVTKLRQAGFVGPVIGGDGFDAEGEWSKHPDLQDVYFTTHAYLGPDNRDPKVRAFDEAYRQAYGGRAPDGFAALGYDAVDVLLAAIGAAGSHEPAKVMASLSDFPPCSKRIANSRWSFFSSWGGQTGRLAVWREDDRRQSAHGSRHAQIRQCRRRSS